MFTEDASFCRVTKRRPCVVCGRPDWCGYSADGRFAVCMRIEDGAVKRTANGGFLHVLREESSRPIHRRARVALVPTAGGGRPELAELAAAYTTAVGTASLDAFAREMGLSMEALRRLRIGWAAGYRAWAFPMQDVDGQVLGIRLRTRAGRKFAVGGGHEGLFIPTGLDSPDMLLIAEGPTDTAVLLDLGFQVVGRPCCSGGTRLLVELVRRHRPKAVVIVADVDANGVGERGAKVLAMKLLPYVPVIKVITPPHGIKDARDWKRAGATRRDVLAVIESASAWAIRMARRSR